MAKSAATSLVLLIVPLRLASIRLPKKVLVDIAGSSLAVHSVGRALAIFKESVNVEVVAAVDHESIREMLLKRFPGLRVVMTDADLPSGTDRVSMAAGIVAAERSRQGRKIVGIVNLQGDIPFAGAEGLKRIAQYYLESTPELLAEVGMTTLSQKWPANQDYRDLSAVKVICDREEFALYFSRHPIPHSKITPSKAKKNAAWVGDLHIGVYGYTPEVLARFCSHAPVPLELNEGLEQLRALWLGMPILVMRTEVAEGESFRGIDTTKDLAWARAFTRNSGTSPGRRRAATKKSKRRS